MINEKQVKRYCCEKISLIENYDKANRDLLEVWHIHHRKEDDGYSMKELIDFGLYYDRPANELIFLTKSEHLSLHGKGRYHSEESKRKISEAMKGNQNADFFKKQVIQLDKTTGEIIKIWSCAREVEIVLGIAHNSISLCCTGKYKSAGGFVWRYKQ